MLSSNRNNGQHAKTDGLCKQRDENCMKESKEDAKEKGKRKKSHNQNEEGL